MCLLLLTSLSLSGTSHNWMEQASLKSRKQKAKAPKKLTSPERPLHSKFGLKLLSEEEVEDTPKTRERQSQSKCQCQFLPLEPEGCDTILHNLEKTKILSWTDRLGQEPCTEATNSLCSSSMWAGVRELYASPVEVERVNFAAHFKTLHHAETQEVNFALKQGKWKESQRYSDHMSVPTLGKSTNLLEGKTFEHLVTH